MPLSRGDITGLALTEAGSTTVAGLLTAVLRATFHVRGNGPFSLTWNKPEYSPESAEADITAYATELVNTLEGNPAISRIGESVVLVPLGEREASVNLVFSIAGTGRFETAVPKRGYTAQKGLDAVAKYAASVTDLTRKFGG
jgi:hypothetical protein